LDSELLLDLAVEGHGTYAFIPDAVIVGTVFVNAVANALSALTQDATIHLTPLNGAEFTGSVLANFAVTEATWGRVVSIGPLLLGQSREVAVPLRIPGGSEPFLEATLGFVNFSGQKDQATLKGSQRRATQSSILSNARARTVSTGYQAVTDACGGRGKSAVQAVTALAQSYEGYVAASSSKGEVDTSLMALRIDVDGRMSKAIKSKERFNRWGKHYVRALMRAHQIQQCTNFMDPGLQGYGGKLFAAVRQIGEEVFLNLPPPKPSRALPPVPLPARTAPPSGTYVPPAAPPPPAASAPDSPNMRTYYAGGGGG
jgi:hypothetical protein